MKMIVSKSEIVSLHAKFKTLTNYKDKVSYYLNNKLGIRRSPYKSYVSDEVLDLYYAAGEIEESLPKDYFTIEYEYPLFRSFDLSFSVTPKKKINIIPSNEEDHCIFWDMYFKYLEQLLPLTFTSLEKDFKSRLKKVSDVLKPSTIESEIKHEEDYFHNLSEVNKQIFNDFKRGIELGKIIYGYYSHYHDGDNYLLRIYDVVDVIKNMTQDDYFTILELKARSKYIIFLQSLKEKFSKEEHQPNTDKIALNWKGSKSQLYYLLRQLKELKLISNSYEDLAIFLINNIDSFKDTQLSTVLGAINKKSRPPKGNRLELKIS